MDATERSKDTAGTGGKRPVPKWTLLEVLGMIVSAALIAAPLLTLAFSFAFPSAAPAQQLWPTIGDPTPTGSATAIVPTTEPTTPSTTVPTTPPTIPPTTPPTTPPATTPPTTPPATTPPTAEITVDKAADRDVAYPGETIVFSVGLTNRGASQVTITVNDTLPSQMSYSNGWHTCAGGSSISPGGGSYAATMVVPAGQTCQIVVTALVNEGCGCYVRNSASWSGGGSSGTAHSQQILLPMGTTQPTTVPTAVPTTPVTAVPTTPPTVPPTVPTTPPTVPPTVPTTPPTNPPTVPPTVPPTNPPTNPPTVPPTNPPTTPGVEPTARPTERPPRDTREPTAAPTAACAQARVSGNVCAAGVQVTISSCCPAWSAQTTSNGSGLFEFGGLTPGTFTVSARGRSRTVRLEGCGSTATVNLCPVTAAPVTPATPAAPASPVTAGPTPTTTVVLPAGTRPSTETFLRLEAGGEDNIFQPGENVTLRLTLHNGQEMQTYRGVSIGVNFDDALELLGAYSAKGEIILSGQRFVLSGATVGPTNDLIVNVNVAVRADTPSGTVIEIAGTARTDTGEMIDSNVLQIEVWGEGLEPPPAGGTPLGAVTPVGGGPEPLPTSAPSTPGTQTPILPPTGAGLPLVGVIVGGGVLLARQLRLRKAGRHTAA